MPHNKELIKWKTGAFFREIWIDSKTGTEDGDMKMNMWNKLVGRERLESFPAWIETCLEKLMTEKHGRRTSSVNDLNSVEVGGSVLWGTDPHFLVSSIPKFLECFPFLNKLPLILFLNIWLWCDSWSLEILVSDFGLRYVPITVSNSVRRWYICYTYAFSFLNLNYFSNIYRELVNIMLIFKQPTISFLTLFSSFKGGLHCSSVPIWRPKWRRISIPLQSINPVYARMKKPRHKMTYIFYWQTTFDLESAYMPSQIHPHLHGATVIRKIEYSFI